MSWVFPPVECCCGVRPSQAANCLPERNWSGSLDGCGDSRRRYDAEAWNGCKTAAGFARGMPGEELMIKNIDLSRKCHDLPYQDIQRGTGIRG